MSFIYIEVCLHSGYFSIYLFFFNDTATTEIYTLSLHDALPICLRQPFPYDDSPVDAPHSPFGHHLYKFGVRRLALGQDHQPRDRKSTRLNSSHANISYAVFCLKKKKKITQE